MKDLLGKDGRKKGGREEEANGWGKIAQKRCNLLTEVCLHKYNTLCS